MKVGWFMAVVLAAAAFTVWRAAPPVSAEATQTIIRPMFTDEQQPGKPVLLSAKLSDSTGKAIGSAQVDFYIMTDVFGQRPMSIGRVATDTSGLASVSYKPSWVGEHDVVVKFSGNGQYGASEAKFQFTAVGPARSYTSAEFGLAPIRAVAPIGVFTIVAVVWIVVIAVLVTTVRGLRAGVPALEAARRRAEAAGLGSEATRD